MKLVQSSFEFLAYDQEDIKKRIERIGRTCYRSEDKIEEGSASKFVAMLNKKGHGAMLEHSFLSIQFTCSRAIADELYRHRAGLAFAMESTRYCNYGSGDISFVVPQWVIEGLKEIDGAGNGDTEMPQIFNISLDQASVARYTGDLYYQVGRLRIQSSFPSKFSIWLRYLLEAERGYKECLQLGMKPQEARGLLPLDVCTHAWLSGNLRAWQHIMEMRDDIVAHPDMRSLIHQVHEVFERDFPELFPVIPHTELIKRVDYPSWKSMRR